MVANQRDVLSRIREVIGNKNCPMNTDVFSKSMVGAGCAANLLKLFDQWVVCSTTMGDADRSYKNVYQEGLQKRGFTEEQVLDLMPAPKSCNHKVKSMGCALVLPMRVSLCALVAGWVCVSAPGSRHAPRMSRLTEHSVTNLE